VVRHPERGRLPRDQCVSSIFVDGSPIAVPVLNQDCPEVGGFYGNTDSSAGVTRIQLFPDARLGRFHRASTRQTTQSDRCRAVSSIERTVA
jgi:hypothetical protein